MLVPFAEWRPDVSHLNSSYTDDVQNVLCADGSYIPFPALVPFTSATPETPLGGITARDDSGLVVIFAGTGGKLLKLNATTLEWDDVSKTSTTYSATSSERWQFAQFGTYVVAVNVNDNPQVFNIGTSTEFEDLGGSPPRARIVSVCGDFLYLGGLSDHPNRVHWSALNDITGWTPGTDNSDYQDFPDGDAVQGITSATNPIIIQKSAIRFGTFVPGSVEIFTFQKIHDKRGATSPYGIASRGANTFFVDDGGFYQITSDGQVLPIGFEKIDRSVFGLIVDTARIGAIGAVDPFFSRVYWAVNYGAPTGFDRLIIYDWLLQRWTQAVIPTSIFFPLASGTVGYTLEGLDDISTSLDALPYSLDSKVWQGGAPVMAAFGSDNKLGFFSGQPSEAILTTQEMGATSGQVSLVSSILPVVDTDQVRLSIGARFRRGDAFVWTAETAPSSNTGIVRKLVRSRFHKFKTRIPADTVWTAAQGLDVTVKGAGSR